MGFIVRPLEELSLGSKLRSLRKRQGITLNDVVRSTQLQRKVLEAFEADAYQQLPDPIYARHYLKQFVEVLNADPEYFLSRFDEECGISPIRTSQMQTPRQRISLQWFFQWRRIGGKIGIGLLALLMIMYIGHQVYSLTSPPNLMIDSPVANTQTTIATIQVSGQTESEVRVTVNGEGVLTDPTGRFSTKTTLTRGLNIILIEARRKYGRPQIVRRTVFLEDLTELR